MEHEDWVEELAVQLDDEFPVKITLDTVDNKKELVFTNVQLEDEVVQITVMYK